MPLINSIFKGVITRIEKDFLRIQEHDTHTIYEYPIKELPVYTEGESLEIRVDQFHKNFELNRSDSLEGPVLASEFNTTLLFDSPVTYERTGEWEPDFQYGNKAAQHFFPYHAGKKFQVIKIKEDPEMIIGDEDKVLFSQMIQEINTPDMTKARLLGSELLSRSFKRIDCYYVLSVIETSCNNMVRAEKYLLHGLSVLESGLPMEGNDWIFNGHLYPNGIYLRLLVNTGLHYMAVGDNDKALTYLRRAYTLDPWDNAGARYHIHSLTKEKLPELKGENNHIRPINPYHYAEKYSIPLHDSYDPNSRPEPISWVAMDPVYRDLLVRQYHKTHPDDSFSDEPEAHIAIHAIAETALADNTHPEPRSLLAQYLVAGYSRHQAIHAIGTTLLTRILQNLQQNQSDTHIDSEDHSHSQPHQHGPECAEKENS